MPATEANAGANQAPFPPFPAELGNATVQYRQAAGCIAQEGLWATLNPWPGTRWGSSATPNVHTAAPAWLAK